MWDEMLLKVLMQISNVIISKYLQIISAPALGGIQHWTLRSSRGEMQAQPGGNPNKSILILMQNFNELNKASAISSSAAEPISRGLQRSI